MTTPDEERAARQAAIDAHVEALKPVPQAQNLDLLSSRVGTTPGQVDADLFPGPEKAAEAPAEGSVPDSPQTEAAPAVEAVTGEQ